MKIYILICIRSLFSSIYDKEHLKPGGYPIRNAAQAPRFYRNWILSFLAEGMQRDIYGAYVPGSDLTFLAPLNLVDKIACNSGTTKERAILEINWSFTQPNGTISIITKRMVLLRNTILRELQYRYLLVHYWQ